MLHWNGTIWEKLTDGIPIGATYEDVWGSGPNDIYIAGTLYRSMGDGRWQYVPLSLTLGPILGIWGSGPNDIWAVGGASVARKKSDGSWTIEQTGRPNGNQAIWSSGPNDVYVVHGEDVLHTTGNGTWTVQVVDRAPLEGLTCIWGSGPDDIYVGTTDGGLFHSLGDGKWYREVLDPNLPMIVVRGIWGTAKNNIYIAAGDGFYHGS